MEIRFPSWNWFLFARKINTVVKENANSFDCEKLCYRVSLIQPLDSLYKEHF